MKEGCPFCYIDQEKTKVVEDAPLYYVAFSNPGLVPGHLLVIPRRHLERPWELNPEERVAIFDTVLKYQQIIAERFAQGVDQQENFRPFLPQSNIKVDHIHWHLKPRWPNDELHQATQNQSVLWRNLTESSVAHFKELYGID